MKESKKPEIAECDNGRNMSDKNQKPALTDEEVREKLGIDEDDPLVLFIPPGEFD